MKKNRKNVGAYLYFDWLMPISDYMNPSVTSKREKFFDMGIPAFFALIAVGIYFFMNLETKAILSMNEILPNILAILIGFSITAISVVASSDKINYKKNIEDKFIGSAPVSVSRYLLIIMVYTLIVEIFLLAFTFFVRFFRQILFNTLIDCFILFVYTFFTLMILSILVRAVVYLYISNYK